MRIAVLACFLVLPGCAMLETPEMARADLSSAPMDDICMAAASPYADEATRRREANRIVEQRGIPCDWARYDAIYARKQAARNAAAANMNVGLAAMAAARPAPAPVYAPPRTVNCTTYGPQTNCTAY